MVERFGERGKICYSLEDWETEIFYTANMKRTTSFYPVKYIAVEISCDTLEKACGVEEELTGAGLAIIPIMTNADIQA